MSKTKDNKSGSNKKNGDWDVTSLSFALDFFSGRDVVVTFLGGERKFRKMQTEIDNFSTHIKKNE